MAQRQDADLPYLKSLRQHDVHSIVAFPGEQLAGSFHVLAKYGHLLLQFLQPHFRFFLNFLEQGQLLGLAPLPDEFLGDALEGLFAAAVLQFPQPELVAFLGRSSSRLSVAAARPSSTFLHFLLLAAEELLKAILVLQPVRPQAANQPVPSGRGLMGWNSLPNTTRWNSSSTGVKRSPSTRKTVATTSSWSGSRSSLIAVTV